MTRWKLVRLDLTEEMTNAGIAAQGSSDNSTEIMLESWERMTAASPSPTDDAELVEAVAKMICVRETFVDTNKELRDAVWTDTHGQVRDYVSDTAKSVIQLLSGEGK